MGQVPTRCGPAGPRRRNWHGYSVHVNSAMNSSLRSTGVHKTGLPWHRPELCRSVRGRHTPAPSEPALLPAVTASVAYCCTTAPEYFPCTPDPAFRLFVQKQFRPALFGSLPSPPSTPAAVHSLHHASHCTTPHQATAAHAHWAKPCTSSNGTTSNSPDLNGR